MDISSTMNSDFCVTVPALGVGHEVRWPTAQAEEGSKLYKLSGSIVH